MGGAKPEGWGKIDHGYGLSGYTHYGYFHTCILHPHSHSPGHEGGMVLGLNPDCPGGEELRTHAAPTLSYGYRGGEALDLLGKVNKGYELRS